MLVRYGLPHHYSIVMQLVMRGIQERYIVM